VPQPSKIAIVAALEREVRPMTKNWRASRRGYHGRDYKFYESESAVLVCCGMAAEPARRATEAVISLYAPDLVLSVGFAGALDRQLGVGDVIFPSRIIDARDGSVTQAIGSGTLVSYASVADAPQKSKLARAYNAQLVDMEAAAVARGAEARGVRFAAVKVVSDASDHAVPVMDRFITHDGQFSSAKFVAFVALRPWLWASVLRLARNSSRATNALCQALNGYLEHPETLENSALEWHPMKRAKI